MINTAQILSGPETGDKTERIDSQAGRELNLLATMQHDLMSVTLQNYRNNLMMHFSNQLLTSRPDKQCFCGDISSSTQHSHVMKCFVGNLDFR